ncbi:Uncharacterised protein [Zhongshania aliphaticivorans]|uniref:TIGR02450 family Trp-rich protein n=1 Tax=Zhongshania aliphaticivorans TaxID=1470434 RepID=A0A5S9N7U1_9GAMM|nr:TIGR02450 family Trp-rich protein [Zhongshania aliphaticivorans]CAA0079650.1 Uncharacterised protein [Zhongshania aliphaticivorans]CAA0086037.1 Uncharacterised protein [Zhongshania aliphaticivorans]
MNTFNPKKLLNSKWTATQPQHKEKHFLVSDIEFNEEGAVVYCLMEAVMSKREFEIQWQSLKNNSQWKMGWH